MPNYFYTAKSFEGKNETGTANAKDIRELARDLKSEGLVLIKAILEEDKNKGKFNISIPFLGVSQNEKIMMTRNLWVMVSAGLSLVKSFDILASQTKNNKLRNALTSAKDRINKGEGIYEALSGYPDIFSELFLNMIKVGEESGTLEEALKNLTLQMEKEHELRAKIKQAMIYPSVILAVMLIIGIIIILVVLPKLNFFFQSLEADLPIYTKLLMWFGDFIIVRWYLAIIVPVLLIFAVSSALKTKKGKFILDTALLKMPLLSSIVKKNNAALLIRSLSSLISSGVPLVRSLEITSGTVGNFYFKKALNESAERVRKGEKLSSALSLYQNIFPFGAIEMMEVGEETGKTSTILKTLAEFYEQEAAHATEGLSTAIEPLLILVLGVCVAFFAFAVIEPMYSVLSSIE
jgi:type IV pilus assembly protein PilC